MRTPTLISLGAALAALSSTLAGCSRASRTGEGSAYVEQAPPPRPVAKCVATCSLKTEVSYKVASNTTDATKDQATAWVQFGGGVHADAEAHHAVPTGSNPSGHAVLNQTSTLDPTIECEYSAGCDNKNFGSCSVGTDEEYYLYTLAQIADWNAAPKAGTGSNNQIAHADASLAVANPDIPGSFVVAHQRADADGAANQQQPPNVLDLIKVKCKLGFQADPKKPVTFKCDLDFDPIEVLNALFWKPARPRVEPREVRTEGAVSTIWTTPPIPPQFNPGVPTRTSASLTNLRTSSLMLDAFAASHCLKGRCDWSNVFKRPGAGTQGQTMISIRVTKIKPVITVGDFACHLPGGRFNWFLPGIMKGPNGTPVLVDNTPKPPAPPPNCDRRAPGVAMAGSDCGDPEDPDDGLPPPEDRRVDESLYADLITLVDAIPSDDRSYEDFIADTGGPGGGSDQGGDGGGSDPGSDAGAGSDQGSDAGGGSNQGSDAGSAGSDSDAGGGSNQGSDAGSAGSGSDAGGGSNPGRAAG